MIAILVGALSSSAAEPPAPYEIVHFPSGKLTLGGELFKPNGEGPFPAILYNHGSAEGMLSDAASTAIGPLYASKGWVFFMPYRRGQGLSAKAGQYIGDQISAAEKSGGQGAAVKTMIALLKGDHLKDQLSAVAWLKQQKFVQPDRIAVAGQSFGGIETVLGSASYAFCAAVDASGGAMSWSEAPALQTVMKESVRSSKSPIFFFQAENDYTLEPSQVLYKEMLASGKSAEMKTYPAYGKTHFDGHSFTWLGSSIWFKDVFAFIQKNCAVAASK
ncbi:MAG TPA: prolyl oligopeptidase family serine peptidase [Bryobacteraceae bacterium]|nr:prolyl oligopeptidase family serine peptidase [Bryobacteraceae bacterium]